MVKENKTIVNHYRLQKLTAILKNVNAYKDEVAALSDEGLQHKTIEFKKRLAQGESLDDLLPEAYAVIREADYRVLGMFPYDVQVLGAIVLHQGNVAQMNTGEGKTLTATLPLYLNALSGEGAMLITVNPYLAKRDGKMMGKVFRWMGLTCAIGVPENDEDDLSTSEKYDAYHSDILYTTNDAFGFDYLFDNLAGSKKDKFLRGFHYVIIDEIDAILLDAAQTPLVVSGAPRVQSNMYDVINSLILSLEPDQDYVVDEDETAVWLTDEGIDKCETFLRVDELYSDENFELVRHINLALRAHALFKKDDDYVVRDEEVKLVDSSTGRILEGTRLQAGQHQALDVKENVPLSPETRVMASITYQNLFKKFKKLSGMSGTAKVAEREFVQTYGMIVVAIPTNKPNIRVDYPDQIYLTLPEKLQASLNFIKELYQTGQPLLIATGSVQMSQVYSSLLLKEGIPHSVLNAYNAAKEAEMIAEAGQLGAVTVATSMAGRGTDIQLGEGVAELGGLFVVGTERFESKRTDLQLRGRAGRQGDPGESRFFVSMEDDLIQRWGAENLRYYQDGSIDEEKRLANLKPLKARKFRKGIENAQSASDSAAELSRSTAVKFDESMRIQRELLYQERNRIIGGDVIEKIDIEQIFQDQLVLYIEKEAPLTRQMLTRFIYDNLSYNFKGFSEDFDFFNQEKIIEVCSTIFQEQISKKKAIINNKDLYKSFIQSVILKSMDELWIDEVDFLEQYKRVVTTRRGANNPVFEYQEASLEAYGRMKNLIMQKICRYIALSQVSYNEENNLVISFA